MKADSDGTLLKNGEPARDGEWLELVHNLLEPPQGYVTDDGRECETTAVLMMCLEGLFDADESPPRSKLLFLEICSKVWDMNVELSQP